MAPSEKENEEGNMEDNSIEEALASIGGRMKKRQKILDEREKELENAREAFEKEKAVFGSSDSTDKKMNDVLCLDVGGTVVKVLRRTLTSVEGSLLASMFSGRWDDSIVKVDGCFFIDQPTDLFMPLIDYFRAKSCETPAGVPAEPPNLHSDFANNNKKYKDFLRMVQYYGVTPGLFSCKLQMHCGQTTKSIIEGHPNVGVTANDWSFFRLVPDGHYRSIRSFEVKLGEVENMQIGWFHQAHTTSYTFESNKEKVGASESSASLDLCDSGFLVHGDLTPVDGINAGNGDVVRCEKIEKPPDDDELTINVDYKWFINGNEIRLPDPCVDHILSAENDHGDRVPGISAKGQFFITKVEYN